MATPEVYDWRLVPRHIHEAPELAVLGVLAAALDMTFLVLNAAYPEIDEPPNLSNRWRPGAVSAYRVLMSAGDLRRVLATYRRVTEAQLSGTSPSSGGPDRIPF